MRVCHVISADLWAGAAVQVYETVTDLRVRGVDVSIAVFNDGLFAQRVRGEGLDCRILDEKRLGTLGIARGLARFIDDVRPQCLHVHAYKEHILGTVARSLAGRSGLPIVRTFHGRTGVPGGLPGWHRLKIRAIQIVERRLLANATIIAVSRDLERHLRQSYPGARVIFVPNGIRLPKEPGSGAAARAQWGIPADALWVGSVARLEPVKNFSCLVRAAAALRASVPGLRVSIFGEGSERRMLEELVVAERLQGVVTLHGFTADVPETVSGFDCFVLSSFHEGLPMSLLEAMAAGVPPVCSRVGGMAELIQPGETGLLFESNDHEELAACLMKMYKSRQEARRIGLAAQHRIRESYSIEVTNEALLRVYEAAVTTVGGRAASLYGPKRR